MVSVSQTNKNIVKSSCLNLSISNEENVIKLEKQIPIMNEEGKKLTPYTFTINNTCNSMMAYSLNLEELEGSTLSSKYIMTMVNDKTYVNMASLSSTDNYYANSVESRVLATGSLGPNASINYSLRLWMDEATPMTTDAMNKFFRSKVVVVATPTKTVDFDYTGTEQAFVAPADGKYKIELWGAQGGNSGKSNLPGGLGAYTSGIISVSKGDIFYIEVGGQGQQNGRNISEAVANNNTYYQPASGGFNGTQGNAANTGGGSSFISGHNGCDAIKEESTENNIIHTGQSVHYSGLYFTDTVMIDGKGYKWTTEKGSYTGMPTHDGTGTMKGNTDNGYARITYIG